MMKQVDDKVVLKFVSPSPAAASCSDQTPTAAPSVSPRPPSASTAADHMTKIINIKNTIHTCQKCSRGF